MVAGNLQRYVSAKLSFLTLMTCASIMVGHAQKRARQMRRNLPHASVPAMILVVALAVAGPVAADDLTAAVKARDPQRVLALLKDGADPNSQLNYGAPINLAAALGPPEIVVVLLDAGADPRMRGFGGASPLHAAVLSRQPEIIKILLDRGAEINALDNLGRTPLLTYASSSAHDISVLKVLLKAGANPNAAEQPADISVLDYIAIQGNADEAELLVLAGANVNARDILSGKTPLHFATDCCSATGGNYDVVRSLLAHGADVNARDINGFTPLSYVRRCAPNSGLLIDILTKAGAH